MVVLLLQSINREGRNDPADYRGICLSSCLGKLLNQRLLEQIHFTFTEHGVGFLVHKDIVNPVMSCRPVSSRLIVIRLRVSPFNITIIQAYAPTSDYDDDAVENFYDHLQEILDQSPKKDILVVLGHWNAKVGEDAFKYWKGTWGRYCNPETNERGLRLLEFACYKDLVLANTLGKHKVSRRSTWHSPNRGYHNQTDCIMVRSRFMTIVKTEKTRSFPGAEIGSDHDLVMKSFRLRLKKIKMQGPTRIKFDLEKLKDPQLADAFQAMIGSKFAPLILLDADDTEVDILVNSFNKALTESASEILRKHRAVKRPWVTTSILDLCDERRALKKGRHKSAEGARKYRAINQEIKKSIKRQKSLGLMNSVKILKITSGRTIARKHIS